LGIGSEVNVRKKIFNWLGREFIELAGEAKPAANASVEAQEIFSASIRSCPWHP
jgi:hypothetical protein